MKMLSSSKHVIHLQHTNKSILSSVKEGSKEYHSKYKKTSLPDRVDERQWVIGDWL